MRKNTLQDLMKLKDVTIEKIMKNASFSQERLNEMLYNNNVILSMKELESVQTLFDLNADQMMFYFFN